MDVGKSVGSDDDLLVGRGDMDGTNDGILLGSNDSLLEDSWVNDGVIDDNPVGAIDDWAGTL